jgi:hypothetical protein
MYQKTDPALCQKIVSTICQKIVPALCQKNVPILYTGHCPFPVPEESSPSPYTIAIRLNIPAFTHVCLYPMHATTPSNSSSSFYHPYYIRYKAVQILNLQCNYLLSPVPSFHAGSNIGLNTTYSSTLSLRLYILAFISGTKTAVLTL